PPHISHTYITMPIAARHALHTLDLFYFVHQVRLQLFLSQHGKDVVRIERPIHQRFARPDAFAFLHVHVHALGNRVFLLGAGIGGDVNLAHAFDNFTEADHAIDFADDRGLTRLARLEQ